MKAVVFHGTGDIRLDDVPEPKIQEKHDAVVTILASAICGMDLHIVRGTMGGMVPGTILGHEGIGLVEELGAEVRNIKIGDRVVICPTIACGFCSYCRAGYFSQCDNANPNGKDAGPAYFGGPQMSGPFDGLQAQRTRIPYANVGLVRIPDHVTDDQAIMISDIFPTGYYGALLAEIKHGDTVGVFGCGPVGQCAIISSFLLGASRVLAVDRISSRLDMAQTNGAEIINFEEEDPVEAILGLTGGIGVDRVIDAVGVDAAYPTKGPGAWKVEQQKEEFDREVREVTGKVPTEGDHWRPGNAPSQALLWAVEAIAKAGTLSVVGMYPPNVEFFPFGKAMMKNLTINTGMCNHRKYIPTLLELVKNHTVDPEKILSQIEPLTSVIHAYEAFDERKTEWIKVELLTQEEYAGAS